MESSPSVSWMPAAGRFPVKVGRSLARTIKARKGEPPQKSKFPEPDFYSFRYNFKPESVDSSKPGTVDVRKGTDATNVTVERASVQSDEGGHIFVGHEQQAKEYECALIYDEELGSYTLEKLDSYVSLTYDKKTTRAPRHPASPAPSRPSTSTSTSSANVPLSQTRKPQTAAEQLEAELERTLLGEDEDAPGEPDDDFADLLPPEPAKKVPSPKTEPPAPAKKSKAMSFTKSKPRQEPVSNTIKPNLPGRNEGEIEPPEVSKKTQPAQAPVNGAKVGAKSKPKLVKSLASAAASIRANTKSTPAVSVPTSSSPSLPAPAPTHPLPPKPDTSPGSRKPLTSSPGKKRERELPSDAVPQQPKVKRSRLSPPLTSNVKPIVKPAAKVPAKKEKQEKQEPVSLAFPGSDGFAFPSSGSSFPTLPESSRSAPAPSGTAHTTTGDDSENEEWYNALEADPTPATTAPPPPSFSIEMEEIIPEPTVHHVPDPASQPDEEEEEEDLEAVDIDENEFERELEAQLEDGDDEMVEPEPPEYSGVPMSLAAQFGGDDSDDFTSSDESD